MSTRTSRFQVEFVTDGDGRARAAIAGITDEVQASGRAAADAGDEWEQFGEKIGRSLKWAGIAVVGGIALIARNTIRAQQELAQLDAILESTGRAAGYTRDQLVEMADAMSRRSTFSSGEIVEAQTRLLSYSGILGENIPRAMQAVIDQSARLGISVTQSAETIGRALESPSKAAAALAQQGFGAAFTDEVRRTIDALVAAGREAEAQVMILEILEESYGGAAEAARDTFGGALVSLKNTLADLLTGSDGSLDGATQGVNDLIDALNDPRVREGFGDMVEGAVAITTALIEFVNWLREAYSAAQEWLTLQMGGNRAFGGENLAAQRRELQAINDELERRDNAGVFTGLRLSRIGMTPRRELEESRARLLESIALNEMLFGDPAQRPRIHLIDPTDPASMGITPPARPAAVDTGGLDTRTDAERRKAAAEAAAAARREQTAADREWAEWMREVEAHESLALSTSAAYTTARQQAARAVETLLEDLEFEASLIGLSNVERAKEIALRRAGAAATEEQRERIGELVKRIQEGTGEMTEHARQAARNMQDAFAEFLFDPFKDGVNGMLDSFAKTLQRMGAQAAASSLFSALGRWGESNSGGGGWQGALGQWLGTMFGGGRAAGGGVQRHGLYEVAEQGKAELLRVNGRTLLIPGEDGSVVPAQYASASAGPAGSRGDVIVNIHNAPEGTRVERSVGPNGGLQLDVLIDGIEKSLAARTATGGPLAAAVKGRFNLREGGA